MDQLLSVDPVCTEIQFTGTLSIDGNYVNVAIDGASKAIGSVKYIDNTTISDLDGAVVVVKGYFVGTSSGKYVNVLPYSIEAAGEVPPSITVNPTSLTFAAAGEAKTVTVTKKNADDCTIEASADNEQFTVEVSGDQVNVTAKENTAEDAISGTLTVKLMKAGEAVATATVALKQNGVASQPASGASLAAEDMKALYEIDKNTSYASFTYTNAAGEWTGLAAKNKNGDNYGLQMNTGKGARIITPVLAKMAKSVTIVAYSTTTKARNVGIYAADAADGEDPTEPIALSEDMTEQNQEHTFTIDLTGKNLNQFLIFTPKGALVIRSVEISFEE